MWVGSGSAVPRAAGQVSPPRRVRPRPRGRSRNGAQEDQTWMGTSRSLLRATGSRLDAVRAVLSGRSARRRRAESDAACSPVRSGSRLCSAAGCCRRRSSYRRGSPCWCASRSRAYPRDDLAHAFDHIHHLGISLMECRGSRRGTGTRDSRGKAQVIRSARRPAAGLVCGRPALSIRPAISVEEVKVFIIGASDADWESASPAQAPNSAARASSGTRMAFSRWALDVISAIQPTSARRAVAGRTAGPRYFTRTLCGTEKPALNLSARKSGEVTYGPDSPPPSRESTMRLEPHSASSGRNDLREHDKCCPGYH